MKKRPIITVHLIIISVLFILLATSCKKDEGDNPETVTDIDGNVYNTVIIGSQVWMKENLKLTRMNDGTTITIITDNDLWNNSTTPAYCWFNNDEKNKEGYGALYNWYAVNSGKLCPEGWHVSTDEEWTELTNIFGGEALAAGKLKATGTVEGGDGLWKSPNLNANNESGFSALPGGDRITNGFIDQIGEWGFWWTSTSYSETHAWVRDMGANYSEVSRYRSLKTSGLSVRCLMD